MTNSLTRDDVLWLGIRLFGVYLVIRAVVSAASLFASLGTYIQAQSFQKSSFEEVADAGLSLYIASTGGMLSSGLRVVVYSLFALYFLRGGNLLFRLASRPFRRSQSRNPGGVHCPRKLPSCSRTPTASALSTLMRQSAVS